MPGHCSWNATYESLLGSTKPFAQQIPLPVRYRESISHLSIQILFFSRTRRRAADLYIKNPFEFILCETMHLPVHSFPPFSLPGNGRFPREQLGAGRLI
jgi:hypothetical protein